MLPGFTRTDEGYKKKSFKPLSTVGEKQTVDDVATKVRDWLASSEEEQLKRNEKTQCWKAIRCR